MNNPIRWAERKIAMNILEKLIAGFIERSCKNYITTIIGALSLVIYAVNYFGGLVAAQYQTYVSAGAVVLAGVALILAKDAGVPASEIPNVKIPVVGKIGLLLLIVLLGAGQVSAQVLPAAPQPASGIQNLYGAGVSYNVGGSPAIAGTGLYAHQVNTSGTYVFSAVDVLPNTTKPFTVTTNMGAGIAQKVLTVGGVPIFMPTAAGVSWNGSNAGWQWNGGAMAVIALKNATYVMPSVRFLKSSVSNGTGYQPIIGVLFGWGK